MYTTYVLYAPKFNKIYIGFSSSVCRRVVDHNELATKGWTVRYRPWKLVYKEQYPLKKQAMKRERQLKSARGRRFIWEEIIANL